ncbi:transposase [Herpetosiphon llansteffanensis]
METLVQLAQSLQRLTDLLWPGLVARRSSSAARPPLVSSRPWTRQIIQTILLHHPDPHAWRSLSVAAIQARLKTLGVRCGPVRATHLAAILAAQVVLPPDQTPPLAARLATLMQQYCHHATHLAALQTEAETLVAPSWAAVLCSIPGMSSVLAARYAAAVGDIRTITSAKALWSLAGLEPSIYASGGRSRVGQSSLAGRMTLRQALIRIGASLSRHCPPVRASWLAARARGKPLAIALIHAANKANRLLFALAISQQPYQPSRA